jgi:hypothetical protein
MASTTQAINTDPIFLESVAVETPAALKTTEENSGELKANEPTEVPKHFGTTAAQNGDAVLVDRYSFRSLYPSLQLIFIEASRPQITKGSSIILLTSLPS